MNHLIKLDAFKPILELTLRESTRDTLVGSACLEFFETMRRENPRQVVAHVMAPAHTELIEKLQATKLSGPTFRSLMQRHEMNVHPEKEEPAPAPSSPPASDADGHLHGADGDLDGHGRSVAMDGRRRFCSRACILPFRLLCD